MVEQVEQPKLEHAQAFVPGDVDLSFAEREALACFPINQLEAWIKSMPGGLSRKDSPNAIPYVHTFIPKNGPLQSGLYLRQIRMPAGMIIVTEIHRTEHPYYILAGRAKVWMRESGWQVIQAPYRGITKPGARRVLIIEEECIWETVHAVDSQDVEEIVAAITLPHVVEGPSAFADKDLAGLISLLP
jgi:hypothetical protein